MNRLFYICASVTLACFSQVFGSEELALDNSKEMLKSEKASNMQYPWGINPSDRTCLGDNRFNINVEYLVWRAEEDDLGFALNNTSQLLGSNGNIERLGFAWDSGVRIGGNWKTSYDSWDLALDWTWYGNSSSKRVTALSGTGNLGLDPWWLDPAASRVGLSKAHWHICLNAVDIELARPFLLSNKLVVRPFIGTRLGTLARTFKVSYEQENGSVGATEYPGQAQASNHYWGLGPRFGVGTNWQLNWSFYFFGDFASAMLYGPSYGKLQVIQQIGGETVKVIDPRFWRLLNNLQMSVGFGWGRCLNKNKVHLDCKIAWEVNQWQKVPAFMAPGGNNLSDGVGFSGSNSNRNLDLNGVTFSVLLGF